MSAALHTQTEYCDDNVTVPVVARMGLPQYAFATRLSVSEIKASASSCTFFLPSLGIRRVLTGVCPGGLAKIHSGMVEISVSRGMGTASHGED